MSRRRWTAADDETLARLHAEGWTGRAIAAEIGAGVSTVAEKLRLLHGRKVKTRSAGVRSDDAWAPPKPPTCKFVAAATAYCAALDWLAKAPHAKREAAEKAVRERLDRMLSAWREFAATQEAPRD